MVRTLFIFILLINACSMPIYAQKQSILQGLLEKHQTNIWKAEQLSKQLLKQGAQSVDWKAELWELGYEVVLKVHTSKQEVMEIYLESRLPSEATRLYVNPQTKQAPIAQLYKAISTDNTQRANEWLHYLDSKPKLLEIANKIFSHCDYKQTIKLSLQSQAIQVNYTNWKNARSIRHKKNYHMLKLDITIMAKLSNASFQAFQFGEHMQVTFSDHSTQQNRREGERILAKIKELHQQFGRD
ncbi:hypothetical protein BKI52_04765 [marine bacterium AO1-C]|nr:hypothetical protein BKI52_04765 [marine bacterium AO1-C]